MAGTVDIAQPEYDMFERNIAHLASRGREVRVRVRGDHPHADEGADRPGAHSSREYVGFLAGLDEGYIQICRTDNQCHVLIDRDAITEVEATGRSIWTYEQDGIDSRSLKRIKAGCGHFVEVARAVASRATEA
ncbi:MAG: hypothetical protein M3Q23_10625 [Actinomycetota bacterium]|nr:hypothetical protein [Actinomycetota bacterium]